MCFCCKFTHWSKKCPAWLYYIWISSVKTLGKRAQSFSQAIMNMIGCLPRCGWNLLTSMYTSWSHTFSRHIWYQRFLKLPCTDSSLQSILYTRYLSFNTQSWYLDSVLNWILGFHVCQFIDEGLLVLTSMPFFQPCFNVNQKPLWNDTESIFSYSGYAFWINCYDLMHV